MLKTVATQYSGAPDPNTAGNGAINVVPVQVTTTWPGGHTSKIVNTWDSGVTETPTYGLTFTALFGSLMQKDEYDFSNSLVRSTLKHYLWQDSTTYLNNNFLSAPVSTTVKDGLGNQLAQTTYGTDQTAVITSGITTGLVAPPAGGNVRGNVTTASSWLNTTNAFLSSTATYFDTGMKASSTQPPNSDQLNRTTTYSYSSTFAGAYMTQTNLPDTQMPDTGAPIVHHIVSGSYDSNTGLLTSFTDENSRSFTYSYDIMLRLTQANHPDGGQTIFTYPDPNTVTRQELISPGVYKGLYTAKFDGVGRPYQTQQVTPSGTVLVDTTYDSVGRESTISNPYYSGSNHSTDPTYGIVTTQYDALSRVTSNTRQDGSVATITYSDNCTTASDEAGKQRKVCTDALGRMTEVDEPNPGASATYAAGSVTISGNEQSGTGTSGSGTVTIQATNGMDSDQGVCNSDYGCPPSPITYDSGTVSVTVNGAAPVTASYGRFSTSESIASALASAFSGNAFVNASASGNVLTLTAIATGSGTNYSLSTSYSSNDSTDFDPPSFTSTASGPNFTGGRDGGYDSGTVRITVNNTSYTVSYGQGSTSTSIAAALAGAINGDGSRSVNASSSGGTVALTAIAIGAAGDYSLSASYTWNSSVVGQPSFTTSTSGGSLTDGYDASDLANNPYVTFYQYDTLGNLRCVHQKATDTTTDVACTGSSPPTVPSSWRQRFFTYDSLSRLLTAYNPESGTISYGYDPDGNLTSKIEPMQNQTGTATVTVTYAYDALNRLTGKTYTDGTQNSSYRYDYSSYLGQTLTNPIGRLVATTAANGTIKYFDGYDVMGRVTKTTECVPGVTNCQSFNASYDFLGDILTLVYPGSSFTMTYQYDAAARLIKATDSNAVVYAQTPTILASGAMQEFNSPNFNNLKYHTDLNSRLQPTEIWVGTSSGSGALFDKQYTYNAPNTSQMNNGNIYTVTNVKDSTRTQTFTYDVLNRLASAHDGTHWGNTYAYDAWGNMQKIPGSPAGENFSACC